MQDGNGDAENGLPDADVNGPGAEPEYPADRLRRRLETKLGGRPLMVYLVLFAGAAVLLILLVIVWISATGESGNEQPPCFDITLDEAHQAIVAGDVERIEIFVDRQHPEVGPSVIRLDLTDHTCRELPKGADNAAAAYTIVGIVDVYNNTHEERVRVTYRRTDVLPEFLVTSTPTPTETPLPTETPIPTETPTTATTETETPASPTIEEAATEAPTVTATGLASPVA